ncbi:MAG: S1 RNA-binding domain-containing protein [Vallitaleaceae bacterium]|nr:S1 RNA-binding domain-containing protein [Vallitaleaceae bacterium]
MIQLGEIQELTIIRTSDFGVYVNDEVSEGEGGILLPKKEVPEGSQIGDRISVFVYRDSEDRLIASTLMPKIRLGEIAMLTVREIGKIGAFLDWGLMKDLLLPFKEQKGVLKEGKAYLVGLYIDKTNRLCATMNISSLLRTDSEYQEEDRLKGIVYSINEEMGVFVAVSGKYQGMIPVKEVHTRYHIGDEVEVRVSKVRDDGKLVLTTKEKGFMQMENDEKKLLDLLTIHNGFINLNDDSDPEEIKRKISMSKRAFKRAVGRLMKAGKIEQKEDGIYLL